MNGAVATHNILKNNPKTAVLVLSMHSEANYVRTCLEAGARGYLLKNAMDLPNLSMPSAASPKVRKFSILAFAPLVDEKPSAHQLTPRELGGAPTHRPREIQ